jgi:hypothetical protein
MNDLEFQRMFLQCVVDSRYEGEIKDGNLRVVSFETKEEDGLPEGIKCIMAVGHNTMVGVFQYIEIYYADGISKEMRTYPIDDEGDGFVEKSPYKAFNACAVPEKFFGIDITQTYSWKCVNIMQTYSDDELRELSVKVLRDCFENGDLRYFNYITNADLDTVPMVNALGKFITQLRKMLVKE